MISSTSILNTEISYFKGKSRPERNVKVRDVLQSISNDTYAKRIIELRDFLINGDRETYKQQKKFLPGVTFSGVFKERRDISSCVEYTNILVFDIDHCAEERMPMVAQCLKRDPYVVAYWLSPSGEGYKGLVSILYGKEWNAMQIVEQHKCAFRQLERYLLERYDIEIDKSGSDIPRLCFLSYDPNICIKNEFEPFVPNKRVEEENEVKEVLNMVPKRLFRNTSVTLKQQQKWNTFCGMAKNYESHQKYRMKVTNIYKHLRKQGVSITSNYRDWVIVAYTIASWVHPYKGKELFLNLCRLDGNRHNEKESTRLIEHAYRTLSHRLSFNYIVDLAYQKGIWLKS